MKILFTYLLLAVTCISIVNAQNGKLFKPMKRGFSIYILPTKDSSKATSSVATEGLHFGYKEKNIPLDLASGRQSILYPLPSLEKLVIFRLKQAEGKTVRVPVVSTKIPISAQRGILILVPADGKLKMTPYWFEASDLNGSVRFQSILKSPAGLVFHKDKKYNIEPGKQVSVQGKFAQNSSIGMINTQLFMQHPKKKVWKKVKESVIHVRAGQAALTLLYNRSKSTYSLLSLNSNGIPHYRKQLELAELLPQFGLKQVSRDSVNTGGGNTGG